MFLFRGVPVPFASKYRKERFHAIAEEISKRKFDLVILQEVCMHIHSKLKIRDSYDLIPQLLHCDMCGVESLHG